MHITFPDSGHAPVDVSDATIAQNEDVFGATYSLKYSASTDAVSQPETGVSLQHLLSIIPDPNIGSLAYAVVSNPGNEHYSPTTLNQSDLAGPTSYQGLEPVFAASNSIEYVRPQRDSEDINGPDRVQTGNRTSVIDLEVHTKGALVHPTVRVGAGPWHVNDKVAFSASFAAGDPSHGGATFAWIFAAGDQPLPGKQSTTYQYQQRNTYFVSVLVSGNDPQGGTYYGQSPQVSVQVGKAVKTPPGTKPTGGPGTGGKSHPTSGPSRSRHGHHEGSPPSGGQIAVTPAGTAPATPGPTGTGGPTAAGPTTPAPTAGASDPASSTAAPGPSNAGGALVQGVLIDGSAGPAGGAVASSATRVAISARRPAAITSSFDARWLWFLAPILLLIGGALGERRRIPHRHGPRSRT